MYSYLKRVTVTQRGRHETFYRVKNGEILSFNVTMGTMGLVKTLQMTAREIDLLSKEDFEKAYEDFKTKFDH